MLTKEILLESKQAQLHQIEEKKALKRRQACVEILWQRVWQRLDESKAQQEQHELKLRNLIENRCQAHNLDTDREQKAQFAKEVLADQRECSQAWVPGSLEIQLVNILIEWIMLVIQSTTFHSLELAAEMDVLKKQEDLKKLKDKRRQQLIDLQDQIKRNLTISARQAQANIREDVGYNILEDRQIYEELMEKRCARVSLHARLQLPFLLVTMPTTQPLLIAPDSQSRLAPAVHDAHGCGASCSQGRGSGAGSEIPGHWVCAWPAAEATVRQGSALVPVVDTSSSPLPSIDGHALMSRLTFEYHIAIIFTADINQAMAAIRKSVSRTGGIKPVIMPTINVTREADQANPNYQLGQPPSG